MCTCTSNSFGPTMSDFIQNLQKCLSIIVKYIHMEISKGTPDFLDNSFSIKNSKTVLTIPKIQFHLC